jgi:hypothetical protein
LQDLDHCIFNEVLYFALLSKKKTRCFWRFFLSAHVKQCLHHIKIKLKVISSVMVIVLASIVADHVFEPQSGETKDHSIGICCFFRKLAALKSKSKDWLSWKQDNVSEWSDMSACRLLFHWTSTI